MWKNVVYIVGTNVKWALTCKKKTKQTKTDRNWERETNNAKMKSGQKNE